MNGGVKRGWESVVLGAHRDQRGQVLPVIGVWILGFLGMLALVTDFGHVYFSYNELQASTNAAALAGGSVFSSTTIDPIATATKYSGGSGDLNAQSNLPGVTMVSGYPQAKCSSTLQKAGVACIAYLNGGKALANSIIVKQTVAVPLYFAGLFGVKPINVTASAMASMRGSANVPYNVAILVDTTASMSQGTIHEPGTGNQLGCNSVSPIKCALIGVQQLLLDLSPCSSNLSACPSAGTSGTFTGAVDSVALYTFPMMTAGTVANDYSCSGKQASPYPYTYPLPATSLATYQILGYQSNYKTSDTSTVLNSSSNLAKSVGIGSGCGTQAQGGEGTYYAAAIYAVTTDLLAQQALQTAHGVASQNAMIIMSDGDASASAGHLVATPPAKLTTTGLYPSLIDQCQQAVTAAQAATAAGITVYSIAYGAKTSGGCSTDKSGIQPCTVMQEMASTTNNAFSDPSTNSGSSANCTAPIMTAAQVTSIFGAIAYDLTVARLIPVGTP